MVDRIRDQHHKQTAMRCHQLAAKVHRQCTCQRAPQNARRNNPQRILGCKRDSAFRNKAQPQHQRRFTGFTFSLGKLAPRQEGGNTQSDRWHHTRCHRRRHRCITLRSQQPHRKRIRRLVDRPAQIDTHHAAQQHAQQDGVGGTHAVEEMGQTLKHPGNRLAHHIDHHQPGKQAGEQRDDQDRLQRFQALRQTRIAIDRLGTVTRDKTGNDPADKTGTQGTRQQATNHPRRQARTVGNRVGDIARQQRHHQFERRVATDLHQGRRQGSRLFIGSNAKHKGQRDQQTARHHHRQHKRHAGQQVLVDPGLFLLGSCPASRGGAFLLAFTQGLVQRGFGLFESDAGAATVNLLAGKTLGRHFDIGCQQHHIRCADGLGTQRIARSHRTLGFHLQFVAQTLGRLLQGFGRHKGVRHASRASGDGNDFRRLFYALDLS